MSFSSNSMYWLNKLTHRHSGYPLATIAFYGPDDSFASKVVVGLFPSETDHEAHILKKWLSSGKDVRQDEEIIHEILEFFKVQAVHRVSMVSRIIGCPHEEGIDYPLGEGCPHCPFWALVERWTGKSLE